MLSKPILDVRQAPFCAFPIAALRDSRLSKNDFRVLGALCIYADATGKCTVSREQLAYETGLSISRVSVSTTKLQSLGWLQKDGKGGCSLPCRYSLAHPDIPKTHPVIPLPPDWENRRQAVFVRDNFACQYCGTQVEFPHCDHVIPRSRGGADTTNNLVTSCPSCNAQKADRTPEEWLQ